MQRQSIRNKKRICQDCGKEASMFYFYIPYMLTSYDKEKVENYYCGQECFNRFTKEKEYPAEGTLNPVG